MPGLRPHVRHRAVDVGRVADDVPRVRRRASGRCSRRRRSRSRAPASTPRTTGRSRRRRPSRDSDGEKRREEAETARRREEDRRRNVERRARRTRARRAPPADPRSRRRPRRRSRRPRDRRPAEIGVIGGSGFYAFLEDTTTVEVETPFGAPSRADHDRDGRRPHGRVPPPPRHGPSVPPAPGPVPGEPVGAEGARGHAGVRTVRRRIAPQGDPAAHVRDQRPGDRLHEVPLEHVLRRPADHARLVRRPVLPHAPRDAGEDGRVAGDRAPRRRHDGRDRGPEVLDQGGVEDVRAARRAT